jgi:hypothetical protein
VWLKFDGINYAAEVWVSGSRVGTMRGAFVRGTCDVSKLVTAGKSAVFAVLVSPQPHPGVPHEHTIANSMGKNGGGSAIDGPTCLSTMGWDWIPAIRDRDTGIWQKVYVSATGPVLIKDPLITTDLPLPRTDSADVAIKATVENVTDQPQKGVLKGSFEFVSFQQEVEVGLMLRRSFRLVRRRLLACTEQSMLVSKLIKVFVRALPHPVANHIHSQYKSSDRQRSDHHSDSAERTHPTGFRQVSSLSVALPTVPCWC